MSEATLPVPERKPRKRAPVVPSRRTVGKTVPTPAKDDRPKKTFSISTWNKDDSGEKVIVYGDSGMGKTTLVSMAPNVVFLGLDDGGRKIVNPLTGEGLRFVDGLQNFWDVRDALAETSLYDQCDTICIDTVTRLEEWSIPYVLETIPADKSGAIAKSIEAYGYGKGYRHIYDAMNGILTLCDELVRRGKNIVFIAQNENARVANPSGEDFLKASPRLCQRTPNVCHLYCEWVDHVARIGYQTVLVDKEQKAKGNTARAVWVTPEVWFTAKSRSIHVDSAISFEAANDDSLWRFMFPDKYEG